MQDFSEAWFKYISIPLKLEIPQGFLDYPENAPSTDFTPKVSAVEQSPPNLGATFHGRGDSTASLGL